MAGFFLLSFSAFSLKKNGKKKERRDIYLEEEGVCFKKTTSSDAASVFVPPECFLSFPQSFFFPQFLGALQRCWSSFLGFRFAHGQQEYSKPYGPNHLFLKGWGLSQCLRDGHFGDYHSVSDGICRKGNPRCGVRCHSHAHPSHLAGSTFQNFPGQIQFSGLLYRGSTPLLSMLALIHRAGPKRTRRLVPPSVCLGQWCEHTWPPGFFQPGK